MNVSLTPGAREFVDGKVESGLYNNASVELLLKNQRPTEPT